MTCSIVCVLMLVYFLILFLWVRRVVGSEERKLEREYAQISQSLINLHSQKNVFFKEKLDVEEEAKNIYTLYELTREITKNKHERDAIKVFDHMLHKHVEFDSCEMQNELPKFTDQKSKEDAFVFSLISKRRRLGYLVVKGCSETEREKVAILGHQYALALRRIKLYQEIEKIAITDGLTEVYTRRYFEERFDEEIQRSLRRHIKMSVLMIDVDYFKKINDEYSHLTGDQVLHAVAEVIKENIRGIDIAGRYGGEEFCVILPDTDHEGAYYVADRIRQAIEEKTIHAYDAHLNVTISVGLSTLPKDGKTMEDLIDHADTALYKAKRQGRNCVGTFRNGPKS